MEKLKVGDEVLIKSGDNLGGKNGVITDVTSNSTYAYRVTIEELGNFPFFAEELVKIPKTNQDKTQISLQVEENPVVNLLLEQYAVEDNYVIPKQLLKQLISIDAKEVSI